MTEKIQNELQDLLKEGIFALREMRKGIENGYRELRTLYSKTVPRDSQKVNERRREKDCGKQKNRGTCFTSQ
jgi:hypothetical protein